MSTYRRFFFVLPALATFLGCASSADVGSNEPAAPGERTFSRTVVRPSANGGAPEVAVVMITERQQQQELHDREAAALSLGGNAGGALHPATTVHTTSCAPSDLWLYDDTGGTNFSGNELCIASSDGGGVFDLASQFRWVGSYWVSWSTAVHSYWAGTESGSFSLNAIEFGFCPFTVYQKNSTCASGYRYIKLNN